MGLTSIPLEMQALMIVRLLVAVLVGALLGYEHERTGKTAGVRTHGMVGLGSALFAIISIHGFPGNPNTTAVAAQVVTGIGFLGAGAILQRKETVHGLTTAACLWVTAAIGLAVGVGMVAISLVAALLAFLMLRFTLSAYGAPSSSPPQDRGSRTGGT